MKNLIILSLLFLASCSTPQPVPSLFQGEFKYEPNEEAVYNIDHTVLIDVNIDSERLLVNVVDKDSTYSLTLSENSKNRYTGRVNNVEMILYPVGDDLSCYYFITDQQGTAKGFISKLKRVK